MAARRRNETCRVGTASRIARTNGATASTLFELGLGRVAGLEVDAPRLELGQVPLGRRQLGDDLILDVADLADHAREPPFLTGGLTRAAGTSRRRGSLPAVIDVRRI